MNKDTTITMTYPKPKGWIPNKKKQPKRITFIWRIFIGIILFAISINLGKLIGIAVWKLILWLDILEILEKIINWFLLF